MKNDLDLVNGNIKKVLLSLALPMIAANFAQTAFGLIDMVWIGSLGSQSVSAVGTASFYLNLATAISTLITVGAGIKFAQNIGSDTTDKIKGYFSSSIILAILVSVVYFTITYIFAGSFIKFYNIEDQTVVLLAIKYLRDSLYGTPFLFLTLTFTSLLTSSGNTKSIFRANIIGLLVNTVLDPMLIFGINGFIAPMGVSGAAWASNIARMITFLILLNSIKDDIKAYFTFKLHVNESLNIVKLGFPVAFQRIIFIFISMYIAKIIAVFGVDAIAAQKIGLQIESITYVTIGGLQGAIVAFIGQNYGASKIKRVKDGYNSALSMAIIFSTFTTLLFLIFPKQLVSIFINEPEVINIGVGYMRAIGISQIFMCIEYITVGVFNGISKTYIPPLVSIIFTSARIPLALLLTKYYGVDGVWYSISLTSIIKGLVLLSWMKYILNKGDLVHD